MDDILELYREEFRFVSEPQLHEDRFTTRITIPSTFYAIDGAFPGGLGYFTLIESPIAVIQSGFLYFTELVKQGQIEIDEESAERLFQNPARFIAAEYQVRFRRKTPTDKPFELSLTNETLKSDDDKLVGRIDFRIQDNASGSLTYLVDKTLEGRYINS